MVLSLPSLARSASVLVLSAFVLLTATSAFAATYSVTITDEQFVPATLKIKTGDSVTFINSTDATQSAKSSSTTGFNTGNIGAGSSKTVTLSKTGTFSYSSLQDSTLTGTITVDTTTGSTATKSATTTTTTKGGTMPVSGTTEVLMGMIILGAGLIVFGSVSGKFSLFAKNEAVVHLDPLSSHSDENANN